jgi:hypothetical protein
MSFDINETLAAMVAAIKPNVNEYWGEVKSTVIQFMQNRKERLALLARLYSDRKLDDADLEEYLEDEKKLLQAELHAVAAITKAMAERAANAALDVLYTAIRAALRI